MKAASPLRIIQRQPASISPIDVYPRTASDRHLLKQVSRPRKTSPPREKEKENARKQVSTLQDGLAICLFGYGYSRTMYDSEYEEEVRKQAVMNEVLPDAEMWKKWEATEAPLRQGRGWYPALDRHFLELLVISEIHCLAHPLNGFGGAVGSTGQAERIHRHASRVRRVACERIGAERLHAYCERVKEAFDAYMQGGWGRVSMPSISSSASSSPPANPAHLSMSAAMGVAAAGAGGLDASDSESEESEEDDSDDSASLVRSPVDTLHEEDEDEYNGELDDASPVDRGRKIQRGQGSVRRDDKLKSPRQRRFARPNLDDDDEYDESDEDSFDSDQHEMEGELGTLRLDLAGVDEVDETEEQALDRAAEKILQAEVDAMELDLELDTNRGVRDVIVAAARKSSAAAALAAANASNKMQVDQPPLAPVQPSTSQ